MPLINFSVVFLASSPESASPYRIVDGRSQEVAWANDFLDAQRMRGLSLCSLRAYAYDLLNLARWFSVTSARLSKLNQSKLLDYVRFQLDHKPKPAAQTVNHRLSALYSLYRFYYGREIPPRSRGAGQNYRTASPFGYGRTRRVLRGLRVQIPRRVVIPLSAEEVSEFWSSFRTFRDLSLVAMMLFNGLRSREALHLQLEDLRFAESEIRVHGKGNRERLLPLPQETIQILQNYLHLERPRTTNSSHVFVSLKGPNRGKPITPAGLRSLSVITDEKPGF